MAFVGASNANQVLRIKNFGLFRSRPSLTFGQWVRLGSTSAADISFVRQDGTLTPYSAVATGLHRPIYWGPGGGVNNTGGPADFGTWAGLTANVWVYNVFTFTASRGRAFRWRYGSATVEENGSLNNNLCATIRITPTVSLKDFVVGGTESGGELMRSGDAVAELTCLPFAIQMSDVTSLAMNPETWADRALFYLPLRENKFLTETVLAGVPRYPLVYGSTTRARINSAVHPPVYRQLGL